MKTINFKQLTILFLLSSLFSFSQIAIDSTKTYIITKHDGAEFVGKILTQNERELLIDTKNLGKIIIPKHEIKEIKELDNAVTNLNGEIIAPELFSTRYFITTNALPLKKEAYVTWNLFGPELHFAVNKHFGAGIMTTWIGAPVVADLKLSFELDKNLHVGVGTLLGTGSWVFKQFRMALPFAAITIGNRNANINFAGGYGYVSNAGNGNGRTLGSVGAMVKVSKNVSLVFDSFIVLPTTVQEGETQATKTKPGIALIIPGVRIQTSDDKAFQFGFTGLNIDSKWAPVPIPMLQWFKKL